MNAPTYPSNPLDVNLRYGSVDELIAVSETGHGNSKLHGHNNGADSGVETWQDAVGLYRAGWMPGMAAIRSSMERIDLPSVDLSRVRLTLDVAGGAVDMGRYLTGDPECMRRVVMSPAKPIVRIAVAAGYAWTHSADKVLANGAPVVALCELLAASGFGIEIDAVSLQSGGDGRTAGTPRLRTIIRIKESNQPVDLGSFAYAIAHPSFSRRLKWGAWEAEAAKGGWGRRFSIPGYYGINDTEREMDAWLLSEGYDVLLGGYPVGDNNRPDEWPELTVKRVVDAVLAWQKRVTGDDE